MPPAQESPQNKGLHPNTAFPRQPNPGLLLPSPDRAAPRRNGARFGGTLLPAGASPVPTSPGWEPPRDPAAGSTLGFPRAPSQHGHAGMCRDVPRCATMCRDPGNEALPTSPRSRRSFKINNACLGSRLLLCTGKALHKH